MANIFFTLRRLRVAFSLSRRAIKDAYRLAGHHWRSRSYDPVAPVRLMNLQVLHGNCSCLELMRIAGVGQSATAYGRTRKRLSPDVLGYFTPAVIRPAKTASDRLG